MRSWPSVSSGRWQRNIKARVLLMQLTEYLMFIRLINHTVSAAALLKLSKIGYRKNDDIEPHPSREKKAKVPHQWKCTITEKNAGSMLC